MPIDPAGFYADEVYATLRKREVRLCSNPRYLAEVQTELTPQMMLTLFDWMVEVMDEFRLKPQTLYLSFNYCHRFLSYGAVPRSRLQLLGIGALFVACKFEEVVSPSADDFVNIADGTYARVELLNMERMLLSALDFEMAAPTSIEFFSIFAHAGGLTQNTCFLASYMMDRFQLEQQSLLFRPSVQAAASLALALLARQRDPWPEQLADATGLRFEDVRQCMQAMRVTHVRDGLENARRTAVRERYNVPHYNYCAQWAPAPEF